MKKVGIITHYYNSLNYGGNLQSYALCKYLEAKGCDAEQICYELQTQDYKKSRLVWSIVRKIIVFLKRKMKRFLYRKDIVFLENIRKNSFRKFNKEMIPHSEKVYSSKNINECIENYDVFITGSDQVWNYNCYNKAFFLDFVPDTKVKVSYAASIGSNTLDEEQKNIFVNSLQSYNAISVREYNAVELLKDLTDKEIEVVLDPTLLLSAEDWGEVCEPPVIYDKYVFTYFLGQNNAAVDIAIEYATELNLKLINIPYAKGGWEKNERRFGDIELLDATPEQFLSLIKYAEYVFTDSYHASVFSLIFQKQFFVFNRDAKGSMNSRILSLVDMFELKERFCAKKEQETLEYIKSLQEIVYNKHFEGVEECRKTSCEFIRKNILEM